jgi:hypothetical protein
MPSPAPPIQAEFTPPVRLHACHRRPTLPDADASRFTPLIRRAADCWLLPPPPMLFPFATPSRQFSSPSISTDYITSHHDAADRLPAVMMPSYAAVFQPRLQSAAFTPLTRYADRIFQRFRSASR